MTILWRSCSLVQVQLVVVVKRSILSLSYLSLNKLIKFKAPHTAYTQRSSLSLSPLSLSLFVLTKKEEEDLINHQFIHHFNNVCVCACELLWEGWRPRWRRSSRSSRRIRRRTRWWRTTWRGCCSWRRSRTGRTWKSRSCRRGGARRLWRCTYGTRWRRPPCSTPTATQLISARCTSSSSSSASTSALTSWGEFCVFLQFRPFSFFFFSFAQSLCFPFSEGVSANFDFWNRSGFDWEVWNSWSARVFFFFLLNSWSVRVVCYDFFS